MRPTALSAPSFADLLQSAVSEPGIISKAYSQFHNYSMGNQLLAWVQCLEREIPPGPIATFPRWKELGRHVKKGEKALMLCMPVTVKRKGETEPDQADQPEVFTRFIYRNSWFVLAQTDGEALAPAEIPSWNRGQALAQLGITEVPFEGFDGNVMGFARDHAIAVSPLNPLPHKTTFHECAHVLLGHTTEPSTPLRDHHGCAFEARLLRARRGKGAGPQFRECAHRDLEIAPAGINGSISKELCALLGASLR